MSTYDVLIVGGGMGGSALAGYLAKSGLSVLVLEKKTDFSDRVRGEWMGQWGVVELKRLGLYGRFMSAGGHHTKRSINYDELRSLGQAEARPTQFLGMHADAQGPLCLEHVVMQNETLAWASENGADICRGVTGVKVNAGASPCVQFTHLGETHSANCRLVVGADGRSSTVRRQLDIDMQVAPMSHLIAGMLIDDAHGWPEDLQSVGKMGDVNYLIFPQGKGKIRIYVVYAYEGKARFNGADGPSELLAIFAQMPIPNVAAIANATPAGPCRSYPAEDAWVDRPSVEGAVLIGDAAGYNGPIMGQGMSITMRDARMVGDLLLGSQQWDQALFEPYVIERKERLRRLRFITGFATTLNARFGEEDIARRIYAFQQIVRAPEIRKVLTGGWMGPESLPAELFTAQFYEKTFGTLEHMAA